MPSETKVTFNIVGLERVQQNTNNKKAGRVGVIGNKALRKHSNGLTNAQVGATHEDGSYSQNKPRRSFLKDPITDAKPRMTAKIKEIALKYLSVPNGLDIILKQLGLLGEVVVQEAFDTGNHGKWQPLSPVTIKKKGHDTELIETAELSQSVSSDVVNIK